LATAVTAGAAGTAESVGLAAAGGVVAGFLVVGLGAADARVVAVFLVVEEDFVVDFVVDFAIARTALFVSALETA